MKALLFLQLLLICPLLSVGQVGIGTTSPNPKSLLELNSNVKGILLPRMTSTERVAMGLTIDDIGMMVYQTAPTKGIFTFNGATWAGLPSLVPEASVNGATLRWDGNSWVSTINLFNQGSSIGINQTNPKAQLHIHSISPNSRIRLSTTSTGALLTDGLVLGVSHDTREGYFKLYENTSLWFATDSVERMRIDGMGNVGINTNDPESTLDINGTVRIGSNGTDLTGIIRQHIMIDPPVIVGDSSIEFNVQIPNALTTATVHVSPSQELTDIMISYARVSSADNVKIKFMNMSSLPNDIVPMMFYITVIQ